MNYLLRSINYTLYKLLVRITFSKNNNNNTQGNRSSSRVPMFPDCSCPKF